MDWDVLIVGAGPAGCATGMALAERDPDLAARTLCIDKAQHPRPKTCGGGLTGQMLAELKRLGVALDMPHVPIHTCASVFRSTRYDLPLDKPFAVIRRDQFDARLADAMQERGITLSSGEGYVEHTVLEDGRIEVTTTHRTLRVRALVAADGAGSKIARSIGKKQRKSVHLAQVDLPLPDGLDPHTMLYDFSYMTEDLFGYVWVFPTPLTNSAGQPMANVGLMQVGSTRAAGGMSAMLARGLKRYGFDVPTNLRLNHHPEWAFDPGYVFSAPGILTVGDAAGVDPLFGEGLSQCLEYGWLAADTLCEAKKDGDYRFLKYRKRVLCSPMGREMAALSMPSKRFYRPGNTLWVSYVFKDASLPALMAAQGQGDLWLHEHRGRIAFGALKHLLFGDRTLTKHGRS